MNFKVFNRICFFLPFFTLLFVVLIFAQSPKDPLWEKALAIHQNAIVIDGHVDLTSRMLNKGVDITQRLSGGHTDIPRMLEGGLDAPFFSIYVAAKYADKGGPKRALEMMDVLFSTIETHPDKIELAKSASEVRRIAKSGKIAALMGLEGGHALQNSAGILRMFHRLGIRYVTLTHSSTTDWADASTDQPRWNGLNELGENMIREMNDIGMIIDVSHVSDSTFWDVLRISKAPVIASHSSCRAICDMPRNMSDEMIKAMADKGGLIMINFGSSFISTSWGKRTKSILTDIRNKYKGDFSKWGTMWNKMQQDEPLPPPTIGDVIDHIEHVIKIAGVDFVGLGSDFDGVSSLPKGLENVTKLPGITYELLKRGYSETDIKNILGENLLRVMAKVELTARKN